MVNPNKSLPNWNAAAAGMWEQFFHSPIGIAGLERLAALRPPLSAQTLETSALAGAKACGYENCLAALMNLTVSDDAPDATNASDNFPALDNDSAWPDDPKPQ